MLVCFDKNGVLKEQLDSYGNLPRVNSQLFKIFAYFKDLDLASYGAAYIKLQRPDLNDSTYPILFMVQADLTYEDGIADRDPHDYFTPGGGPGEDGTYPCYLFDFAKITNDDLNNSIVTLLDTPGEWQATITLISTVSGAANVVGTISFHVEGSSDNEEETLIGFNIITHNFATIVATKLNANSAYYMRSVTGFESIANGGVLPKSIFSYPSLTVWDKNAKAFYRIVRYNSGIDEDHYSADYEKIVDLNDKLNISEGIVVVPNIATMTSSDFSKYVTNQLFYNKSDETYYKKIDISPYYAKVELGSGILGHKNVLTRYVIGGDTELLDISDLFIHSRSVIINYQSKDYIFEIKQSSIDSYNIVAFDVYNKCFYQASNVNMYAILASVINDSNKIDFVVCQSTPNTVYGVDSEGNQTSFAIGDLFEAYASIDYVNNNILVLSSAGGTLTEQQYAYALTKNARVFYSTTGVFYEKYFENSAQILFKAISTIVQNTSGTLTISNSDAMVVTKSTKVFGFGNGASEQTYGKGKLDADFATKQYVLNTVSDLKRNAFIVIDTDDYHTLDDFLDNYPDPEQGYIYLYPVGTDQQEVTDRGYYQYIWESVEGQEGWFCIGTTQIDLSNFEITFEQETFSNGVVSVTFANNTDYQLISLIDTVSVALTIPSGVSQGWIGSCTFTVGNSVPTFSLVNNSSYNVVFIVNNRKADVSGIALNLDTNGIVECLAECNGFDIRVYMKEVTNS